MKILKISAGAVGLLCSIALANFISPYIPFAVTTDSIPPGIYWAKKVGSDKKWKVGELGCFPYIAPSWARDRGYLSKTRLICKQVAGTNPDKIHIDASQMLSICNSENKCREIGMVRAQDSAGRPVPPYFHAPLTTLKEDTLFMWGPTSDKSLDSRYLGPIQEKQLKLQLLKPLWLFDTDLSKE